MTDVATTGSLGDGPVGQMVSALAANGFPRMPASVMMTLMTSEEPMLTAEQLAERLGVSAAAISGAVRYLTTIGFILSHRVRGSRRLAYQLKEHAWYTASLEKSDLYLLTIGLAEAAAPTLGPIGRERMEEMADFFRFLEKRLPEVLGEWKQLRAQRDPGP